MPFLTVADGAEIFYKDWGGGEPVVLVGGWPLSADMWEHQALYLAEHGFRVVSYDRRGFGRSSQVWEGYHYDRMADDLAALIERLDLRGITLVGFSMGGGEVVRYLSRHGQGRVARAVLVSCVTPYLLKTDDNPEGVDGAVFDGMVDGIKKDRAWFMREFAAPFYGRTMMSHTVSEDVLDWFVTMALQASPKATIDCVRAFSATDFREEMTGITIPVLVVHGSADKTVPIEASGKRAAALLKAATLFVYDREPHGLTATAAARLNADLLNFIKVGPVASE
jgi:non-heme chloroperoxidase